MQVWNPSTQRFENWEGKIELKVSDIQIGVVELKDGLTDARAQVLTSRRLSVEPHFIDSHFTLVDGSIVRDVRGDVVQVDTTDGVRVKRTSFTRSASGDVESWSEVLL